MLLLEYCAVVIAYLHYKIPIEEGTEHVTFVSRSPVEYIFCCVSIGCGVVPKTVSVVNHFYYSNVDVSSQHVVGHESKTNHQA